MSSIYRSEQGERRIKSLYDELLATLDREFDRQWLDTRFGETHVLVTGETNAPPLLVFHGGNMVNPVSLEWFLPLADEFRIYAPDTIGHPGYSAQTRLSPGDDSYSRWVTDVLDELGFERVPMVGPSYGGGIVLRTAAYAPERISRAGLVVPTGLGTGSVRRMVGEIIVPMMRYRLFPSRRRLERAVQPIFSEPVEAVDDRIVELVGAVFDEVKLEREFPKTVSAEDLAGFDAPTLLAVAENDIFFPPDAVVPHARNVIRKLEIIVRMKDESHVPAPDTRRELVEHLSDFLTVKR